ncbi:TPA: hypothetical protein IBW81_004807 [Escherichia coli]|nr:hypothetical protein [Escherichia coli]
MSNSSDSDQTVQAVRLQFFRQRADDVNNEPYGCAEGLCVVSVNGPKIKRWLRAFPSVLNETGDRPAIKREYGQFG